MLDINSRWRDAPLSTKKQPKEAMRGKLQTFLCNEQLVHLSLQELLKQRRFDPYNGATGKNAEEKKMPITAI